MIGAGSPLRKRLARLVPARIAVARSYRRKNPGHRPDLRHPRDWSEKLCWLKLHGHTPLHARCADKLEVRGYVADRAGEEVLIPLLFHTDDAEAVTPGAIPARQFVLKTTHDSGGVVICRDRDGFDWARARDFLRWRMGINYYWNGREPGYRHLTPRVMAEALLPSAPGTALQDYKLWCFHGRVEMIQVMSTHAAFGADGFEGVRGAGDGVSDAFMSRDWARLPYVLNKPPMPRDPARPRTLERMIALAEALSSPFAFVRVDLYDSGGQPWFGEMTFFPSAGTSRFRDPAVERRLGDLITLPGPGDQPASSGKSSAA